MKTEMCNDDYDKYRQVTQGLRFRVTNFGEFRNLIERARKEAHQLSRTIDELEYFDFLFELEKTEESVECFHRYDLNLPPQREPEEGVMDATRAYLSEVATRAKES